MVRIDGDRLMADLKMLRTFGAVDNGVVRPTFSDADMAARRWLCDRMTDAGLEASIDGVANVIGRSRHPGPALVIGSHSDTQPRGGWLDGAMGVIYALEVVRALAADPTTAHLAVDAVAWSDEEGTYTNCLGSTSFVGDLRDDVLDHANADGETIARAIERVGLADTPRASYDSERHVGYLEAHIEQGPHLEATGHRIGVVTSIVGIRHLRVHFRGEQNHAGTTPMALRKDAAAAMFQFGARLADRLGPVMSETSVWTIGKVIVEPGAAAIIPGEATIGIQWRDPSEAVLIAMDEAIRELAREMDSTGPVSVSAVSTDAPIVPTDMDPGLRDELCQAAERTVPGAWVEMPSAAGHDAMMISHHLRCGMVFIPSIGGVSHDFAEDSTERDIVTGCQVLADAAASILLGRS